MRKPVSALDEDYERIFPPSYNSTKGGTKMATETGSKITKSAIASSENVSSKTNTTAHQH